MPFVLLCLQLRRVHPSERRGKEATITVEASCSKKKETEACTRFVAFSSLSLFFCFLVLAHTFLLRHCLLLGSMYIVVCVMSQQRKGRGHTLFDQVLLDMYLYSEKNKASAKNLQHQTIMYERVSKKERHITRSEENSNGMLIKPEMEGKRCSTKCAAKG